jgi:hypothetical protein
MDISTTYDETRRDREERRRRTRRGLLAGVVVSSLGLTVGLGAVAAGTATATSGTGGAASSGRSVSAWSGGQGLSPVGTGSVHATSGGS